MSTRDTNGLNPFSGGLSQDRCFILDTIQKQIEKGTGLSISHLQKSYKEEQLFNIGLKHVTTTKKALCAALNIPGRSRMQI
jgi:hypothetical protein